MNRNKPFGKISAFILSILEIGIGSIVFYKNSSYSTSHPRVYNSKPKNPRDISKYSIHEPRSKWNFWQVTDKAVVKGISRYVDFNVFNGNKNSFNKFLIKIFLFDSFRLTG